MSQHTTGQLCLQSSDEGPLKTADGMTMMLGGEGQDYGLIAESTYEADARRIVACWNACIGIETEKLEKYPAGLAGAIEHEQLLKECERLRTALAHSQAIVAKLTGDSPVSQAAADVLAERQRQVTAEGWTPGHDDRHAFGELACAAACYALGSPTVPSQTVKNDYTLIWPWHEMHWKPSDERRNLVKAGALILAEIERLDRDAA